MAAPPIAGAMVGRVRYYPGGVRYQEGEMPTDKLFTVIASAMRERYSIG